MAKNKKSEPKRESKAGLMTESIDSKKDGRKKTKPGKNTERTPKISKDQAEVRDDRPVH